MFKLEIKKMEHLAVFQHQNLKVQFQTWFNLIFWND